jgi:hypothetical protein
VFPETTDSPPLVPETTDQETPLPLKEVSAAEEAPLIERITVTEHFLVVERVPARQIERRAKPREPKAEREMEAA